MEKICHKKNLVRSIALATVLYNTNRRDEEGTSQLLQQNAKMCEFIKPFPLPTTYWESQIELTEA